MTRKELKAALLRHDWYYDYSDDISVWRRGTADKERLQAELRQQAYPFEWWDTHAALHSNILEDMVEVKPGEYRHPKWLEDRHMASWRRSNLITRAQAEEILAWFNAE